MKKICAIFFILALCQISAIAATDNSGMGYVGTLPDLTKKFAPSEPISTKPDYEQVQKFQTPDMVKPAPRENPAFVNIILKPDKTSQYLNDLNEFIPMLEKIYDSIEDKESVQLFNAKVYFFTKHADWMRDKYAEQPEGQYISFKKLMELSTYAKSVALLRSEALKYNPYLAYGGAGYIYDPNNINEQLDYLMSELERTILLLKDAN